MNSILEWAQSFFPSLEKIGFLVSITALLASTIASILARHFADLFETFRELRKVTVGAGSTKRHRTHDSAFKGAPAAQPPSPSEVATDRALSRIDEAKKAMAQQKSARRWSTISANLLTVSQYVIGGVLASSFVQEALSTRIVGLLGVLVLIASLIKQHFHPELSAANSQKKHAQLKALIRTSEDQLTILDAKILTGQDHTDAMIALLTSITQRLTEIENPEAFESLETH